MIALVLLPPLSDSELALPRLILEIVPVGFSRIILAGFVSAMMSTADSALLASSTLFTRDVYKRFLNSDASDETYSNVSRIVIIVLGAVMTYSAIEIGNVVRALTLAYDLLSGCIFVPIFGAFFWKRATWQGALTSICASAVVVVTAIYVFGFSSDLRNCRRESLALEGGDESPSLFTFTVRYSLRCSPCVFLGIRRGTSAPIPGQSDKFGLPDRGSKYPFGIGWVPTLNNQVPPNPVPLPDGIGVTATWHGQHLVGV
ncbi:sodium:solute symporter family transporter [Haladaptatus halobius]|uniref:sodium:solute symporter family transporter n=1 Tax=Haladaptatus halobius TaxID=2884875 RepID=UPI001D0B6E92|nr:hypothetical protein [Haladaptatus halobius]